MMEELIKLLNELLDLTIYESKVYAVLLVKGSMTLSELSRESGVPKTKIYQIARSLEEKDMVEIIRVRPYKIYIKDPYRVINEKIRSKCADLENKKEILLNILEKFKRNNLETFAEIASVKIIDTEEKLLEYLSNDLRKAKEKIIAVVSKTPVKFNWSMILEALFEALSKGARFIYIVPKNSMSKKIFTEILRRIICGENLDLLLKELFIQINESLYKKIYSERIYRDLIDKVELYEAETEIPIIVIDDRIVYDIFTDPISSKVLFSVRYENNRYARALASYIDLLKLVKGSGNLVNEIRKFC
ncbi:MAG: TrmB family transcriptional regulator [Sulfolobales archaeon]